ncbi:MAG: DUF5979 domain-containing protein [Hespellia sp.]|nr:DUF5979 domain-containing protein [Hespellia sp.]
MMKKRGRIGSAFMLAAILAISVVTVPKVQAATEVVDKACSIEFQMGGEFEELSDGTVSVPVKLYKVASINASGNYTAEGAFASMDFSSVSDSTTAEEWLKMAESADELVTADMTADAETTVTNGTGQIGNLAIGLYLVKAETSQSPYYNYSFTPYLISLPDNHYAATGDDTWIYDLTGENAVGLKPEQDARLNDLEITKTLTTQNITMGRPATFVFEAVITTLKGETMTKNVALTFDSATTKKLLIKDLPAGSTVVVTEVYSGASYEVTGDSEQTQVIDAENVVGVAFTNDHDGKVNGGYGIVNNYKYDGEGEYDHTQLEDNSEPSAQSQ